MNQIIQSEFIQHFYFCFEIIFNYCQIIQFSHFFRKQIEQDGKCSCSSYGICWQQKVFFGFLGILMTAYSIAAICESNPQNVVIVDEAYVDFGAQSALPLIAAYDNLLVTRTFSKSRCLAGGRLGYAFGNPAIIADLEKIKYSTNPYNINRLTQLLGSATIDAEPYYREKCREIMETRAWTAEQLESLGFEVLPSDTNFLFAKTEKMDGGQLYEELKTRGILVRHFGNIKICQYNRITIGTKEQMASFINTLKEVLL